MKETELYKRIKSHLHGAHLTRIENSISSGVPDVCATLDGTMRWLELKTLYGHVIQIRPLQIVFAHNEWRAGGDVFFVYEEAGKCSYIPYSKLRSIEPISSSKKSIHYRVLGLGATAPFKEVNILLFGGVQHHT